MNLSGELRGHLLAVGVIVVGNAYLLRLMEVGVTGSWQWLLLIASAAMLGSSIYVGLVLGVGSGILLNTFVDSVNTRIDMLRIARNRVVEQSRISSR